MMVPIDSICTTTAAATTTTTTITATTTATTTTINKRLYRRYVQPGHSRCDNTAPGPFVRKESRLDT